MPLGVNRVTLARQPIFDRSRAIFGYELFSRDPLLKDALVANPSLLTSNVILNAFLEMGIERVAGQASVFVKVTRDYLLGDQPLPPMRGHVYIEIDEDVLIDEDLIAAARSMCAAGYRLVLDDFVYSPELTPLLKLAKIVKLDLHSIGRDGIKEQLSHLAGFEAQALASGVDTYEDYTYCRDAGVSYFQGHFLSRPEMLQTGKMPSNRLALLELLTRLHDPRADLNEIVNLVQADVALSYRLVRCTNSPLYSLRREISHVRDAVMMLGLTQVRQWVTLLVLSSTPGKPPALMSAALVRAKMCELLAKHQKHPAPDALFTAGLFSVLDALLDVPMSRILESLPLAAEVSAALAQKPGPAADILSIVRAHESAELEEPRLLALDPDVLMDTWFAALDWAREADALVQAKA